MLFYVPFLLVLFCNFLTFYHNVDNDPHLVTNLVMNHGEKLIYEKLPLATSQLQTKSNGVKFN
ncbi:hypothetical protein P5673_021359 [Acropora cervicornis]|uniref:Uncharacterized protein n=1 Tax=Acropora cervicornis TaxID=6130 RepID=A0AAD9Q877_ACRCE|nr:hypothetical protein P5673_021359 [Acropora cervicornis]